MPVTKEEVKRQWQAAWRDQPLEQRGTSNKAFGFFGFGQGVLPDDWEGRVGDPWQTVHSWLLEADREDGLRDD